jgi:hypothetical protein
MMNIGAMIGVLANCLKDVYIHHKTGKDMWDAVNVDYEG